MEYYVYVWRDSANVPFYVGKGKGKRAYNTTTRSKEFKEVYAKGGCAVEIVDWFIHESQAHALEVELIARYGRRDMGGLLVNKTDGGEGASGRVMSDQARAKLAASALGNTRCVGRAYSSETRAKIGASRLGRTHSAETRAKIGAASVGRVYSPEARAKISVTHKGRPKSDETRARMVNALRRRPPKNGFKGVSFNGSGWRARFRVDGEECVLGTFPTPEEAARAYDAAVDHYWGPGPWYRNFSDSSSLSA